MDRWMDAKIDGYMDRWVIGLWYMDRWIDGWMDEQIDRWVDRLIDRKKKYVDRNIENEKDGKMDRWIGGKKDRWIDEYEECTLGLSTLYILERLSSTLAIL